ncbi:ATP-grasp domain-containing protein [Anaerolineales bacterium HSG25]|nr:ATP-grasp domain-containing protein [Anaerolineales bacterium HSG25]
MPQNLLLTGGRAPVTLSLARMFHAAGWTIFVAESMPRHLCRVSRSVQKNYHVPAPRFNPTSYIQALKQIIEQANISLLIPTCEEIFYIAQGLPRLTSTGCQLFVEPIERLRSLHNKWLFNQLAQQYGLSVPKSVYVTSRSALIEQIHHRPDSVIKPVFSRFGTAVFVRPQPDNLPNLTISSDYPWLVQQYIEGQAICTYSLAHQGRLTAHSCYRSELSVQGGATVMFQPLDHSATYQWVDTFVRKYGFTGQIAFDFIETVDKELFALECNPRATNGALLFTGQPNLPDAFVDPTMPCLHVTRQRPLMVMLAMLLMVLPDMLGSQSARSRWWRLFRRAEGVIYNRHDPWPFWFQPVSMLDFIHWSIRHGISLRQASTFDIEWNGTK